MISAYGGPLRFFMKVKPWVVYGSKPFKFLEEVSMGT